MTLFVRLFVASVFSFVAVNVVLISGASAFRCGDGLIEIGDTKSKVLIECGKPTNKSRVGTSDVYYPDQGRKKRGKSSKALEQWSYNCGAGDFIYVLTFEGGKLIREETDGHGKGKSACRGK